jgi:hypothetical protein
MSGSALDYKGKQEKGLEKILQPRPSAGFSIHIGLTAILFGV